MIYLFLVLAWFPDVTQPLPVTAGFTVYTDGVRLKNILSLDIFQLQERFANGKKNNWSSTGLLGTAPPINTQGWSYAHKWRTSSVFIKMTGLNLVFSDPSCALPTSSKCDRWAGVQSAHWRPQRSDLFGVSNGIRVSWAGMSEQGLCFCFCVLTYKALKVQLTQDDILFSGFTYPDTVA